MEHTCLQKVTKNLNHEGSHFGQLLFMNILVACYVQKMFARQWLFHDCPLALSFLFHLCIFLNTSYSYNSQKCPSISYLNSDQHLSANVLGPNNNSRIIVAALKYMKKTPIFFCEQKCYVCKTLHLYLFIYLYILKYTQKNRMIYCYT